VQQNARIETRALIVAKVLAYSLTAYGAVGLFSALPYMKWIGGILLEAIRTRSTWPFFQNYGVVAVIESALRVLTVSGILALGLLMLRRSQLLFPGLSLLATLALIKAVFFHFLNPHSSFRLFDRITDLANSFALPCSLFVAVIVFWKSKASPPLGNPQIPCSRCSYDLSGLIEPRCPECGRVYTLDEFYQL
jgi:hypothetical protein